MDIDFDEVLGIGAEGVLLATDQTHQAELEGGGGGRGGVSGERLCIGDRLALAYEQFAEDRGALVFSAAAVRFRGRGRGRVWLPRRGGCPG